MDAYKESHNVQNSPNPVIDVFKVLDLMRPLAIPTGFTKFERVADRLATTLWLFAGLMLSIMGFLAMGLLIADTHPASAHLLDSFMVIALLGLLAGVCGALLFLSSLIVGLLMTFVAERKSRFETLDYSFFQAAELLRFDDSLLSAATKVLEIEIEAIQGRMAFFLGGRDKVAVVAVLCGSWIFFSEYPLESAIWNNPVFYCGAALIVGLLIGGFFVGRRLGPIQYQKGLLELAVKSRNILGKLPSHHGYPIMQGSAVVKWGYRCSVQRVRRFLTAPLRIRPIQTLIAFDTWLATCRFGSDSRR